MTRAITFPFRIDNHGHIGASSYEPKVLIDRVRSVLNTQVGDRVMRPNFGFDGEGLVMHLDEMTQAELSHAVSLAMSTNLPSVKISSVSLTFDDPDSQTGTLLVEFTGPDGTTTATQVAFTDGNVTSPISSDEVTS